MFSLSPSLSLSLSLRLSLRVSFEARFRCDEATSAAMFSGAALLGVRALLSTPASPRLNLFISIVRFTASPGTPIKVWVRISARDRVRDRLEQCFERRWG